MAIGTPVLRATEVQQNTSTTTTSISQNASVAAASKFYIWLQTRTTTQATMTITNNGGYSNAAFEYFSATFVTQAISMNLAVITVPAGGYASGTQWTCTTSGNTGKQILNIAEATGLDSATAAQSNGAGASGAPNSGSITTTTNDTLVFGCFAEGGAGTLSVSANSTGFTTLQPASTNTPASSPIHGFAEYRIRSATGTDTEAPTESIHTNSAALIVAHVIASASNITLTPTVAAATAAGIVPGLLASLSPTVASATGAGLAPVLKLTVAPTVAAATAAGIIPAPTISLAPTVAASSAAGIAPFIKLDIRLLPTVAAATADAITPGVQISLAPTVATATAAAHLLTQQILISLAPTAATATAAGLVPTFQSGIFVSPPVATASADGVAPALKLTVAPTVAAATAAAVAPVVAAALAPTVASSTAAGIVPALTARLAPTIASATAAALAPALKASLAPTVATSTASALSPGLAVALTPLVAAAAASALPPALAVAIAPQVAEAVADALIPVVSGGPAVALFTAHLAIGPNAETITATASAPHISGLPTSHTIAATSALLRLAVDPGQILVTAAAAVLITPLGYSNQALGGATAAGAEAILGRSFHGLRQNADISTNWVNTNGHVTEYNLGRTTSYRAIQNDPSTETYAAAISGSYDTSFTTTVTNIVNSGKWTPTNPFILCYGHEVTVAQWAPLGTAQQSIDSFRHFRDLADSLGATVHTKTGVYQGGCIVMAYVGWVRMFVGANGVGAPTAGQGVDDYDPDRGSSPAPAGTSYYEYLGCDVYNTLDSPGVLRYGTDATTLLRPVRDAAWARHKDWIIGEFGCPDGSTTLDHTNKAAWLDSARTYLVSLGAYGPGVCRVLLMTIKDSAENYNVDSSSEAQAAFARIGAEAYFA